MASIRVYPKTRINKVWPTPKKKALSGVIPKLAARYTPAIAALVIKLIINGVMIPQPRRRNGAKRAILCFLRLISATKDAIK